MSGKDDGKREEQKVSDDTDSPPSKCVKFASSDEMKPETGTFKSLSSPESMEMSSDCAEDTGKSPEQPVPQEGVSKVATEISQDQQDPKPIVDLENSAQTSEQSPETSPSKDNIRAFPEVICTAENPCLGLSRNAQKLYLEFGVLTKAFQHYEIMEGLAEKLRAHAYATEKLDSKGQSVPHAGIAGIKRTSSTESTEKPKSPTSTVNPMERVLRSRKISICVSPSKKTQGTPDSKKTPPAGDKVDEKE